MWRKPKARWLSQVEAGSPGAKAGLKVGDVITELNGKQVSDAGQLQIEVGQKQPGATIKLDVLRDGKTDNDSSHARRNGQPRPGNQRSLERQGKPRWGLGLEDLTPDVRQQIQASGDLHGAVVEHVQPGSPADNAGLQRGDVIIEVDRKPVRNAEDVQNALAAVPKGQDALVLVWSNGGSTFRVLHSAETAPGM